MLWKMWVHYSGKPLVVEADTCDEAFRLAREVDPDYCTAQPMDEREAEEYKDIAMREHLECRNVAEEWGEFECSECGMYADFGSDLHMVNVCPHCRREIMR